MSTQNNSSRGRQTPKSNTPLSKNSSKKTRLCKKNSKKRYDIGNVLNVKVDKVDMINQDVKFEIV